MLKGVVSLTLLAWLSGLAAGDNVIREWGGAQGGYVIVPASRWVTILVPGTYKFQATDANNPGGLGDINHITVDPNCAAGTVNVYVVRDPNEVGGLQDQPGVRYLKEINLSAPNVTGNIQTVRTTASVAELGAVSATALVGYVVVGDPNTGGADILNNIAVEQFDGRVDCHTMQNLTATGTGPHDGEVRVHDSYAGTLHLYGPGGGLWFQGAMNGTIQVDGPLGWILFDTDVGGDVTLAA
jgi:hypothetical protein